MSAKEYEYIIKRIYQHLFIRKKDMAKLFQATNYTPGKTKIIRFGILKGKKSQDDVVVEIKICE